MCCLCPWPIQLIGTPAVEPGASHRCSGSAQAGRTRRTVSRSWTPSRRSAAGRAPRPKTRCRRISAVARLCIRIGQEIEGEHVRGGGRLAEPVARGHRRPLEVWLNLPQHGPVSLKFRGRGEQGHDHHAGTGRRHLRLQPGTNARQRGLGRPGARGRAPRCGPGCKPPGTPGRRSDRRAPAADGLGSQRPLRSVVAMRRRQLPDRHSQC